MITLASADPILPPLLVLPIAALGAWSSHASTSSGCSTPPCRPAVGRIRTVTGVLSLFTITLTAIGFGVITSDDARIFLLLWLTVIGLLGILVVLAAIDMANNVRIHAAERKHIRDQLTTLQHELRTLAHIRRNNAVAHHADDTPRDA